MSFEHEALFYERGLDGFVDAIGPMVAETLDAGGRAAVAAPPDRVQRLQELFGPQDRLALLDMHQLGVNPARIIPAWRDLADEALAGQGPFLGVGEPIWVGRTDPELDECHRHEALINVAFADDPAWRLVCPYDVDGLPEHVIEDARMTHPEAGRPVDGLEALEALERPLAPVPDGAVTLTFDIRRLREVRELVEEQARRAGLPAERAGEIVLAATELAGNSVRHGGGGGTLVVWSEPGRVTCQTSDRGHIPDPMVGRRRPGSTASGGRGMWIVHQLCDLVQIRRDEHGTVIRATLG